MIVYKTKKGDILDWICWKHYGVSDVIEQVLEVNNGLAEYGPSLPRGLSIILPDVSSTVNEEISLWD